MRLSIFTPSHDSRFLPEAYASIKDQPFDEWSILHNNGGTEITVDDPRVKQIAVADAPARVGHLKAEAVAACSGDALLELDHDDLLAPDAIAQAKEALTRTGFAYSNTAPFGSGFTKGQRYSERYGWRYRETELLGHKLDEHVSFAPNPDAVSRIWYAPNHLRAFTREAYDKAGGYDRALRVLDDQDLMARLYKVTEFAHIDAPLYLQRMHDKNTQLVHNAEIQKGVWTLYDKYAAELALTWATRKGLRKLDLGGRLNSPGGYETVDRADADIVADLEQRWPFEDSSVGVVRAFDVFEHLRDPLHAMKELHRVLAPGGWAFIQVPSTDGRGAFQDPTHRSFWNENCVTPEVRVLCADFQWRRAGDLQVGDQIIAFDEQPNAEASRGKRLNITRLRHSVVEGHRRLTRPCISVSTDIGPTTVASKGHPWLVRKRKKDNGAQWEWRETKDLQIGDQIAFFGKPWGYEDTRAGGWLAGMFDGEGCFHVGRSIKGRNTALMIAQRESPTLDRIKAALTAFSFSYREHEARGAGKKPCQSLTVTGGLYAQTRMLGMIAPARFCERDLKELYDGVWLRQGKTFQYATVTKLQAIGDQEVCGIQTSTRTMITDGYLTHNSFLYYTHANWAKYIGTPVRFQATRLYTTAKDAREVCWTLAHLVNLKDGYRPPGIVDI